MESIARYLEVAPSSIEPTTVLAELGLDSFDFLVIAEDLLDDVADGWSSDETWQEQDDLATLSIGQLARALWGDPTDPDPRGHRAP